MLIGLGYLIARLGILGERAGDGIADFVFKIAVPILLALSLARSDFSGDGNGVLIIRFWVVYFTGVLVVWLLAWVLIRKVFGRDTRAASIAGVAAAFSNLVLLGIPLIERALGQDGLAILFVLIAIHLPIMMTISTFLMEIAVRADGLEKSELKAGQVARNLAGNLAKNPIIIGIFVGLLWRFSGLGLADVADNVLQPIARTTGPLALLSLGMGLIKYGIKGNVVPATGLTLLSLMAFPALVYGLGTTLIELPPLWLKVAVLAAASPTGVNAYLIATYFKVAEGLATNTIVLALLGSVASLSFWLIVMGI